MRGLAHMGGLRGRALSSSSLARSSRFRKEWKREQLKNQPHILRLAIDCSLSNHYRMSDKELKDLVRQISFSYGYVMRYQHPSSLQLVGLEEGGDIEKALQTHFLGYKENRVLMETTARAVCEEFPRETLCYMSPYSPTELQEVTMDKVYVLGGVVDKVGTKMLSERVARNMDVPTARLPIKSHLTPVPRGRLDLPLNQVVKMMLSVHSDGDWTKAIHDHFPKRKRI